MSYHYALRFANGLINTNNKLKSHREVIDWLKSVGSGTYIFYWKKKKKIESLCYLFVQFVLWGEGFLGLIDLKVFWIC